MLPIDMQLSKRKNVRSNCKAVLTKKTEENKIIIHQNSKIYFIRTEVTKISSDIKLYKNTVSSSYVKLITEILQKITEILQKFRYQRSN